MMVKHPDDGFGDASMDGDEIEKIITNLQFVWSATIFSFLALEIILSGLPCKACSCEL